MNKVYNGDMPDKNHTATRQQQVYRVYKGKVSSQRRKSNKIKNRIERKESEEASSPK